MHFYLLIFWKCNDGILSCVVKCFSLFNYHSNQYDYVIVLIFFFLNFGVSMCGRGKNNKTAKWGQGMLLENHTIHTTLCRWNGKNIPAHIIQRYVISMWQRILDIIRYNGDHTRYEYLLHYFATNYSESNQDNSSLGICVLFLTLTPAVYWRAVSFKGIQNNIRIYWLEM